VLRLVVYCGCVVMLAGLGDWDVVQRGDIPEGSDRRSISDNLVHAITDRLSSILKPGIV